MVLLDHIAAEAETAFGDFDEAVTWTPQGGSATLVRGIHDLVSELLDLGEIIEADGVAARLDLPTASVPGIRIGDAVTVRGATYRVVGTEPDGTGRTIVVLGKGEQVDPPIIKPPAQIVTHGQGVVAVPRSEVIGGDMAIDYGGKVYSLGNVSSTVRLGTYEAGLWSFQTIAGADGDASCMFIDSSGNLLFSIRDSGTLWRVPAGGGAPIIVIGSGTSPPMQDALDEIRGMCEDRAGNLYCTEYGNATGMFKSSDGGATWSLIVNGTTGFPGSGVIPDDHLHTVVYDPYRDVLIAAHGDTSNSFNQVSHDGGISWSSWTGTDQSVGITFDADYIYISSDLATDRRIYRARPATQDLAGVIASVPQVVFDPQIDLGLTNQTDMGHAWWADVDSFGNVIVPWGAVSTEGLPAYLTVSTDQGNTWRAVPSPGTATPAANAGWSHALNRSMHAQWSGFYYGSITGRGLQAWRTYPNKQFIAINQNTGGDPKFSDGVVLPWEEIVDYGLGDKGLNVGLSANYSTPYLPGTENLIIAQNGNTFDGTTETAPHRVQDCEGDPLTESWTANTSGTATLQSTEQVLEGNYSVKIDLASGQFGLVQRVNVFAGRTSPTTMPAGQESAWIEGRIWLPASISIVGDVGLISMSRSGNSVWFGFNQQDLVTRVTKADDRIYIGEPLASRVVFGGWNTVKLHVYRATSGRVQSWINGALISDIVGINTIPTVDGDFATGVGINTVGHEGAIIYIDDIACSYAEPRQPSGITLSGPGQSVLP